MKKIFLKAALFVAARLLILYGMTFRYRVTGEENLEKATEGGRSVVFYTWHNQIFPVLHYHRGEKLAVIISASKDGDMMAYVAELFGYRTARGSSSRHGTRALLGAQRIMKEGWHGAVAVDGPKGPVYKFKPGAVYLAKITDKVLMPVIFNCKKRKKFASWDGFVLPAPFSRVEIHYGEPVFVSANTDPDIVKKDVEFIEKRTLELTRGHSTDII
ncbi:lysophospholipid acyltransferase family protein [Limisalsivibrio acetivorans]|uniref:lysophospholipid acyltransferase family protein n=1 Tax=Limisalsivibrio acetivorans TaxID=1304888 RepID=UPI0003B64AFF|nr:lysophospholipid acyltransferase family protein [Limisalsivibrio acetivorans]